MGKVEFVSYDGEFPNFCRGCFVCRIDGIDHSFGGEEPGIDDTHHYSFWERDYDDWFGCSDWDFCESDFPATLMGYYEPVCECFIENVPDLDDGCDGCR